MSWWRRSPRLPPNPFDPSRPVLQLTDADWASLGQLQEGFLCLGGIGAGKTSGPGHSLARNLVNVGRESQTGCGFVVFTVKPDECERWRRLCVRAGREADFLRFGPGSPLRLDALNYELSHPHATVEGAAQLLDQLVELSGRQSEGRADEQFWSMLARRVLRTAIAGVWLAEGKASINELYRFLCSLPVSREQLRSDEWAQTSYCGQCLNKAAEMDLPPDKASQLSMAVAFVTEWAGLSEKTRSTGHMIVANILSLFIGGPVGELCSSGVSSITPDEVMEQGKVLVIDMPVLLWRQPGQFLQVLLKTLFQRAVLRREVTERTRRWCSGATR